jgi:hypothetical protein
MVVSARASFALFAMQTAEYKGQVVVEVLHVKPCTGLNMMSEKGAAKQEAGKAVRLLNEAQTQLAAATDAAEKFDKLALGKDAAKKRGRTRDHEAFSTALAECVNTAHAKVRPADNASGIHQPLVIFVAIRLHWRRAGSGARCFGVGEPPLCSRH